MSLLRLCACVLAGLIIVLPPTLGNAAGRYFAPEQESASAAIVADARGALHAAHTGYDQPNKGKVYYRTCSADCLNEAAWTSLVLPFEDPISVQIDVTPEGAPRLLVVSYTSGNGASRGYDYASCDVDCLDRDNWMITRVASSAERVFSGLFQYKIPERTFAVDAGGQPHFIFVDANYFVEPDHYGAFYMTCLEECGRAANWIETDLAGHLPYRTEQFDQPVLAATPDGKLRVLATVYPFDSGGQELEYGLYYLACEQMCIDKANWQRTRVIDPGFGSYPNPTWDLEVTNDGRPRIAFFAGDGMKQEDLDNELIYMWCDADCLEEESWNGHVAGWGPDKGESPDLELNSLGQPRIAHLTQNDDLAFTHCEENCESGDGVWNSVFGEENQTAAEARPTALPFHCDGEVWSGFMPRLALAGDTPWMAYDLTVEGRCLYKEIGDPNPIPTAVFHEIWRGARLVKLD